MDKGGKSKVYDLEERTFQFAKATGLYVKELPHNITNLEYGKQVVRASGSVGANYIEANEALSKKDFLMRAKICRKEAKEAAYWLRLIIETNDDNGLGDVHKKVRNSRAEAQRSGCRRSEVGG